MFSQSGTKDSNFLFFYFSSFMIKNPWMIGGKKYTSKEYFIFNPDYSFKWQLQQAKDFVFKCKIRCYGVLIWTGRPECPHLFYCVNKEHFSGMMKLRRKDYEIFETFEECLAAYQEWFDDMWKREAEKIIKMRISSAQERERYAELEIRKSQADLEAFNSLTSV